MLVMLALGFAAGLPNLLIFDTLSAWLRQVDVPLRTIGFFSLATLAYSLKFLWAPLVDRTAIPLLTPLLGHRRAWMLTAQAVIILGLWLVSGSDPAAHLWVVAAFAVLVAFASATQDVVIDAWRIEAAGEERQGAMAAMYQWGYRVAILTAGIAPLVLAEQIDWSFAYAAMAALMAIGVAAVLAAPREQARPLMPPLLPPELPARPAAEALEWIARLSLLVGGAYMFGVGFTGQFAMIEWPAAALGATPEALAGLTRALGAAASGRVRPGRARVPGTVVDRGRGVARSRREDAPEHVLRPLLRRPVARFLHPIFRHGRAHSGDDLLLSPE